MFGRKNDSSSLPEQTWRSPEIVLDVAREVAEGGEVETVGDVGEREAVEVLVILAADMPPKTGAKVRKIEETVFSLERKTECFT